MLPIALASISILSLTSSKTNVKGARKKGATLRDWFEKEDWRRVDDPSKKCGE